MRVDWAIPCRYVEVHPQGGATIVGAGADVHSIAEMPASLQLRFAVRFVGAPDELNDGTAHPVTCRVFDPEGELLAEHGEAVGGAVTQVVPGYVAELTFPISLTLDAAAHGTYRVEFDIDETGPLPVPVHVIAPEGA